MQRGLQELTERTPGCCIQTNRAHDGQLEADLTPKECPQELQRRLLDIVAALEHRRTLVQVRFTHSPGTGNERLKRVRLMERIGCLPARRLQRIPVVSTEGPLRRPEVPAM